MSPQSQKVGTNRAASLSPHFGPNAAKSANSFVEGGAIVVWNQRHTSAKNRRNMTQMSYPKHLTHVTLLLLTVGCTPKPPEQQFIDDAMRAVGGRDRVIAVKSIVIEGTGVNYNLGQDMKPEAATQQFAITGYKREDRCRAGQAARRADAHAEVRLLPGPAAADAGPGPRRRHRLQRRRRLARPRGSAPPRSAIAARSWFHHPITALIAATVPLTTRHQRPHGRQRAPGGFRVPRSRVDDDDRCGGPAVVDLEQDLSPESR